MKKVKKSKKTAVLKKKQAKPKKVSAKKSVKKKTLAKTGKSQKYEIMDIEAPVFKGKKKKYYELLMKIRDQIISQLKFHSEEALNSGNGSELAGSVSNHMADYGSDNFLHDMELGMITNEGEVIEMIDEAIQRLVDNEFGKCLDCGCNIHESRLKVKPYARFCIKCKSAREESGHVSPD